MYYNLIIYIYISIIQDISSTLIQEKIYTLYSFSIKWNYNFFTTLIFANKNSNILKRKRLKISQIATFKNNPKFHVIL